MNEENRQGMKIPVHIAIIMDGNGRWAKRRGMPRTFGHTQGAKVVEQILEDADHMGADRSQGIDESSAQIYEDQSCQVREKQCSYPCDR